MKNCMTQVELKYVQKLPIADLKTRLENEKNNLKGVIEYMPEEVRHIKKLTAKVELLANLLKEKEA